MAVQRYDDLDGKAGAESISFSLNGKAYEIDLGSENAAGFLGMFRPYLAIAREVGLAVYLPANIGHAAGVMAISGQSLTVHQQAAATGGAAVAYSEPDHSHRPSLQLAADAPPVPRQPEHTTTPEDRTATPTQAPQPPASTDPEVRDWAKRWSVPNLPSRGRVPARIREAYDAFQADDRDPWKALLKEAGTDPRKAAAKARRLNLVDAAQPPEPSQEDVDRQRAAQVGRLSSAQLTVLRQMFNAPDGRATSDRRSKPSFGALKNRGCCTVAIDNADTSTYEITDIGRLWFDVRDISPNPADPADN
ncbi:histone-like nucleoid-structuring protein Lsr2 [Streptomyces sp. NPDC006265]|uniref:Lsr2 dimerization domain-containing protein n=1 Tax=Streptomyces sp. NPDC006265 TaxID=3156740 RepID=UPI0033B25291